MSWKRRPPAFGEADKTHILTIKAESNTQDCACRLARSQLLRGGPSRRINASLKRRASRPFLTFRKFAKVARCRTLAGLLTGTREQEAGDPVSLLQQLSPRAAAGSSDSAAAPTPAAGRGPARRRDFKPRRNPRGSAPGWPQGWRSGSSRLRQCRQLLTGPRLGIVTRGSPSQEGPSWTKKKPPWK